MIRIPAAILALALGLAASSLAAQTPQTAAPAAPRAAPAAPPTARPALIDINTASAAELDALPGIGPVRAQAIIKGRPYKGKDELVRRKILSQSVYDGIKDRIIARQP